MSLADILADRYLSKDQKKKKDKKEKKKWEQKLEVKDAPEVSFKQEENEEETPKPSGWKRVGDDKPVVRAGLQTAQQLAQDVEAQKRHEYEDLGSGNAGETVYRDATGKRVDIRSQLRDSANQQETDKADKERRKRELNQGLVQQDLKRKRQQTLEEIESESFAVGEDDAKRNQELRDQELFNDPAASFLTKKKKHKREKHGSKRRSHEKEEEVTSKVYQGPFSVNRFGIKPGFRWDGVDRSNGFEQKWFRAQADKQDAKFSNAQADY